MQAITADAAQANSKDTLFLEIAVDDASRTLTLSRKATFPSPPLDPTEVSSASESSHDVRVVEFDFTGTVSMTPSCSVEAIGMAANGR